MTTQPSTPASAGQTFERLCCINPPLFNPRKRGADNKSNGHAHLAYLQPPQARGRQIAGQNRKLNVPSTPASAGQTHSARNVSDNHPFNPRKRGADTASTKPYIRFYLQPPQARGRRSSRRTGKWRIPSTPASAGQTIKCCAKCRITNFNPRKRGADGGRCTGNAFFSLQPPQARGRLFRSTPIRV